MTFGKSQSTSTLVTSVCVSETMRISLHGGISNAQAAPEAELPQEASTTL